MFVYNNWYGKIKQKERARWWDQASNLKKAKKAKIDCKVLKSKGKNKAKASISIFISNLERNKNREKEGTRKKSSSKAKRQKEKHQKWIDLRNQCIN